MPSRKSPQPKKIRVLFAAAEADPIIKVGGLGDVIGSLPKALQGLAPEELDGVTLDVRLVLPFYPALRKRGFSIEPVADIRVPGPGGGMAAQVSVMDLHWLTVYLIAGGPIEQEGPVYSQVTREDGAKFTFFSLAILEMIRALDWQPDILHANDWHTALAVYCLKQRRAGDAKLGRVRAMLSVHNLPFMGGGTEDALRAYDIPAMADERLPAWGNYQPLPMGLASAGEITTVSPTYAREIMMPEFGCGLEHFLRLRSARIHGILNGLDEGAWDPVTDTALAANYDCASLNQRLMNKRALLKEFGLPPNMDLPLLILISRFDQQKGVDLAIEGLRQIAGLAWGAILLGTGDRGLEDAARKLETEFPYRVRAAIRFDGQLARRMYGGGDMLLMPSRYEPCGLAQMIAMRYGCIPVARATGGLRDTVMETQSPETSTGFLFEEASPEALAAALRKAIGAFGNSKGWQERQMCAMQQNFSWKQSAQAYGKIYEQMVSRHTPVG